MGLSIEGINTTRDVRAKQGRRTDRVNCCGVTMFILIITHPFTGQSVFIHPRRPSSPRTAPNETSRDPVTRGKEGTDRERRLNFLPPMYIWSEAPYSLASSSLHPLSSLLSSPFSFSYLFSSSNYSCIFYLQHPTGLSGEARPAVAKPGQSKRDERQENEEEMEEKVERLREGGERVILLLG
ncbi:hypothetical protein E2C01_074070 [Portunus trituberculatus]|uniref:Uncharacterized protein n=1 Tax=Portunus trituberculatus TaxID=210409 RepID=A0A5B7I2F6_PORTR|nr:hypothetical protein [Portunus trituberculatus]